jgi:opacity protein-like surface antigen
MSRKHLGIIVGAAFVLTQASDVAAQLRFQPGYTDVGPTIGLGGIGSASLAIGGRFERAVKPIAELGNGVIGVGIALDYYSWSSNGSFGGTTWESSYRYIPIGVTGNYHFVLGDNSKFDPFVGAGLGYSIVSYSCNYNGDVDYDCGGTSSSALYFIGHAGVRYFVSDKVALYGDIGAGAAALNIGAMMKLR